MSRGVKLLNFFGWVEQWAVWEVSSNIARVGAPVVASLYEMSDALERIFNWVNCFTPILMVHAEKCSREVKQKKNT